jgi:hypothetical protein
MFIAIEAAPFSALAFDPDAIERLTSKRLCAGCEFSGAPMEEMYLPGAVLKKSNMSGRQVERSQFEQC